MSRAYIKKPPHILRHGFHQRKRRPSVRSNQDTNIGRKVNYLFDKSSMSSFPAIEIVLISLASRSIFFRSTILMRLLSNVRK